MTLTWTVLATLATGVLSVLAAALMAFAFVRRSITSQVSYAVSAETDAPVVPIVLHGTRSVLREHRWPPIRVAVAVSVAAAGHAGRA